MKTRVWTCYIKDKSKWNSNFLSQFLNNFDEHFPPFPNVLSRCLKRTCFIKSIKGSGDRRARFRSWCHQQSIYYYFTVLTGLDQNQGTKTRPSKNVSEMKPLKKWSGCKLECCNTSPDSSPISICIKDSLTIDQGKHCSFVMSSLLTLLQRSHY